MTFLFDIGNVLLPFDYQILINTIFPENTHRHPQLLELLDERRIELETGAISQEEYISWALKLTNSSATHAQFCAAWRSIFNPNDSTINLVKKLHSDGHRLILFSNINSIHHPWIYSAYPFFNLFHGAVMSYEIGFMKPSPQFYLHAIQQYQLIPAETIYIDDLPANIDAGLALGFQCHLYDYTKHDLLVEYLATKNIVC